ncbi:formylglycine-generating enzyme family protein [bacterium]|nr:formylglycine-generating enzyme family protein [bacterium]
MVPKDINGNVWEWCWDKYENFSKYPEGTKTDYTGEETGPERVTRGGSWFDLPYQSRSAMRFSWFPDLRQDTLGFRLVRLGPSVK